MITAHGAPIHRFGNLCYAEEGYGIRSMPTTLKLLRNRLGTAETKMIATTTNRTRIVSSTSRNSPNAPVRNASLHPARHANHEILNRDLSGSVSGSFDSSRDDTSQRPTHGRFPSYRRVRSRWEDSFLQALGARHGYQSLSSFHQGVHLPMGISFLPNRLVRLSHHSASVGSRFPAHSQ